jgi:hypothetical protein
MDIQKVRKGLQLISGISAKYTIDTETMTLVPVTNKRPMFGSTLLPILEETIDAAIVHLPKQIDVLCLLKTARIGLLNIRQYLLDKSSKRSPLSFGGFLTSSSSISNKTTKIDRLVTRIDNSCSRFEHRLIFAIEQIPQFLESELSTSITSDYDSMLIVQSSNQSSNQSSSHSSNQTPNKTPNKTPPQINSVPLTPPSSPRRLSNMEVEEELYASDDLMGSQNSIFRGNDELRTDGVGDNNVNLINFSILIPNLFTLDKRLFFRFPWMSSINSVNSINSNNPISNDYIGKNYMRPIVAAAPLEPVD